MMSSQVVLARALAVAFCAGQLEIDDLVDRGARLLGKRWRWLRPLARRVCAKFAAGPRPRTRELTEFLLADRQFFTACNDRLPEICDRLAAAAMAPLAAARSWSLPTIETPGALAAWLLVSLRQLDALADVQNRNQHSEASRREHYHYQFLHKPGGAARLIEAPKHRLKAIQRRILVDILDHIPPHDAAHGFRRGCSIRSFAQPHVGKQVVLRIDFANFFPSLHAPRIQALFRTAGYPEAVARLLTSLCTNVAPQRLWAEADQSKALDGDRLSRLYACRHLPQGAPTSPALANLCAYRLDARLSALAAAAGASYTRYADDLAFSGDVDFTRAVDRFRLHVCATAMEEGFVVNHYKTRVLRRGARQKLAGLVVNERINIPRREYDCLKAILTNCIRYGAESQNRDGVSDFQAHLQGRLSFVATVHPQRADRLRRLFDQVRW